MNRFHFALQLERFETFRNSIETQTEVKGKVPLRHPRGNGAGRVAADVG
jgi:hypothetical protein